MDSQTRTGKHHIFEPAILIKIGKAAANRDEYQIAKECYSKILEIDPKNNEAAFLLKRLKYFLDEDKEPSEEDGTGSREKTENVETSSGFLTQQEEKRISIRPKQQYDLDPNIINKDQDKIYHVEEDDDEEILEEVSKHVARQIKKKNKSSTRNMGLAAGVICILMIIILLWYFGYLNI
jgi:tetratricopeptide (TPR) repeat protein